MTNRHVVAPASVDAVISSAAATAFSYSLGMPLSEEVLNAIFLISLSVPFKPGVGRQMMAQPLLMLSHDVQPGKTPSTGPTDELPLHSAFVALMTVQAILDRITSIAAWAIIPENRFWNTVWRSSPLYASVQKKCPGSYMCLWHMSELRIDRDRSSPFCPSCLRSLRLEIVSTKVIRRNRSIFFTLLLIYTNVRIFF